MSIGARASLPELAGTNQRRKEGDFHGKKEKSSREKEEEVDQEEEAINALHPWIQGGNHPII